MLTLLKLKGRAQDSLETKIVMVVETTKQDRAEEVIKDALHQGLSDDLTKSKMMFPCLNIVGFRCG